MANGKERRKPTRFIVVVALFFLPGCSFVLLASDAIHRQFSSHKSGAKKEHFLQPTSSSSSFWMRRVQGRQKGIDGYNVS